MRCASKTLKSTLYSFVKMSTQLAVNLLAQGNNGNEILNILNALVSDIEQENINDVAAHFASLQGADLTALDF
tara:strand:- start:2745 stop:2963 length:219 start_codon:yes stop_codon:yes gene_type:complete